MIYMTVANHALGNAVDWENPDQLMELWQKINSHPRIMAREMNTSVALAKRIKNMAANKAAYLRCKAEGNELEADKYLRIFNRLASFDL